LFVYNCVEYEIRIEVVGWKHDCSAMNKCREETHHKAETVEERRRTTHDVISDEFHASAEKTRIVD
jgi:hypothetical protein